MSDYYVKTVTSTGSGSPVLVVAAVDFDRHVVINCDGTFGLDSSDVSFSPAQGSGKVLVEFVLPAGSEVWAADMLVGYVTHVLVTGVRG